MRAQKIGFPEQEVLCVFPETRADLPQAISSLGLDLTAPVIVLIGDENEETQPSATHRSLETLARIAEDTQAFVICGGLDAGFMGAIGQIRRRNAHTFPLVGIAPESLVTWQDGPPSTSFLWMGTKRQQLAPHFSHFILVPCGEFEDAMPWMMDAASLFSGVHPSVTILVNGGNLMRKDVQMSVNKGRPVIVLGGSGNLANDLSADINRSHLISVVPENDDERIMNAVRAHILVYHTTTSGKIQDDAQTGMLREMAGQALTEDSPTIISRRDEFKPINSQKSERRLPESFIK